MRQLKRKTWSAITKKLQPKALSQLSFHAACCQPLNKVLLEYNEHQNDGNEGQDRHGKNIAPLGELVLTKEPYNGDGQGAQLGVVDDGVGPGIFLPGGQKIEYADRSNGGC